MVERWWALGAALVAVTALAAGCGGEGESGTPSPPAEETTSTTTAPTTTVLSDEDAVLAAYQGYWDTWLAANDPPNPDHPDLAKYATGRALAADRATVSEHRATGQFIRLPESSRSTHDARVNRLDGSSALVADCSIDDALLLAWGSEYVLDDSVVTWSYEAELVNEGGWRVSELRVLSKTDGVSTCGG